jgi:hypothetical protein
VRTPPVRRHSGTHKVSGKPEHKDQGYLLLLAGSKPSDSAALAEVFSKTDGRSIPRAETSRPTLVHEEHLAPADHLDRAGVEVILRRQQPWKQVSLGGRGAEDEADTDVMLRP